MQLLIGRIIPGQIHNVNVHYAINAIHKNILQDNDMVTGSSGSAILIIVSSIINK